MIASAEPVTNTEDQQIAVLLRRKEKLLRIQSLEQEVRRMEQDMLPTTKGSYVMRIVCEEVSREFKVRVEDLVGKRRYRWIVTPRHVALYVAINASQVTFADAASNLGGRDHGTAIHANRQVAALLDVGKDADLKARVERLVLVCRQRLNPDADGQERLL